MHVPAISIIVPVYKVEKYLQECIDSILAQTFTNFELILVNDGSPDNCGNICDANAARDSRIRVIHQGNQGVTRARANGVHAARGEYIAFVDGDDTIPTYALSTLFNYTADDIDIITAKNQYHIPTKIGKISKAGYMDMLLTLHKTHGGPWARLYRAKLFDTGVFDIPREIRIGEDHIMNIRLGYKMKNHAYICDDIVYHYRKNCNSAMHTWMKPDVIAAYLELWLSHIPPQDIERYLPHGLADRLLTFWVTAIQHCIFIPESARKTRDYMISILKYSSIKYGFLSGILFYSTNPLLRACVICIQYVRKIFRATNRH